jgi:hypothetical protein
MLRLAPICQFSGTSGIHLLFTGARAWLICPSAVAQESRGTIVGQILDGAGAMVPGGDRTSWILRRLALSNGTDFVQSSSISSIIRRKQLTQTQVPPVRIRQTTQFGRSHVTSNSG